MTRPLWQESAGTIAERVGSGALAVDDVVRAHEEVAGALLRAAAMVRERGTFT